MIEKLIDYKKCIPSLYVNTVYDIDFKALFDNGYRVVFFDLDNTLISYKETTPNNKSIEFIKSLKSMGFEVMIVSNNSHKTRVKSASEILGLDYVNFACKPLKRGFKKALKKLGNKYTYSEVIEVGDQLLTDVYGSKRMKFYTVLVDAIDHKSEIFATKLNRRREKNILNKIKKKDIDSYNKYLLKYEEKNL